MPYDKLRMKVGGWDTPFDGAQGGLRRVVRPSMRLGIMTQPFLSCSTTDLSIPSCYNPSRFAPHPPVFGRGEK